MFPAICSVFICRGVYAHSFMIYIWMGKTLANDSGFTKFAKDFPCHHFALYGIRMHLKYKYVCMYILYISTYIHTHAQIPG